LNNELREIRIPGVGNIEVPDYTWNRPATVNYPGGTQRSLTYDVLMRLETLAATAPDSTPIMTYGYPEYDEVGNIVTKTTLSPNIEEGIVPCENVKDNYWLVE
jgi:hypothetical protein